MQLNRENLNTLANWLEAGAPHESLQFDMSTGMTIKVPVDYDPENHNACITACCIAGAAVTFFDHPQQMVEDNMGCADYVGEDDAGDKEYQIPWWAVRDEATRLLFGEATDWEDSVAITELAERLFLPQISNGGSLSQYSDPAWAARTVRHLMDTGNVDWKATYAGNEEDAPWYYEAAA